MTPIIPWDSLLLSADNSFSSSIATHTIHEDVIEVDNHVDIDTIIFAINHYFDRYFDR